MQEIQQLSVSRIRPDSNQPRKTFDEETIAEMAQSIKTEGVINPIEVDGNDVIVTGEVRWRAAKLAGLETIPSKVIEIDPSVRFRRQVIENIHHNTMTAWDTAIALSKLLGKTVTDTKDPELKRLSEETGKSTMWLFDMVQNVQETDDVKEYLKSKTAKHSLIRDIRKRAPQAFQERLKKKVVDGDVRDYETTIQLIEALKRAPDKADELLSQTYHQAVSKNVVLIYQIAPDTTINKMAPRQTLVYRLMELATYIERLQEEDVAAEKQTAIGMARILSDKLRWLADDLERSIS